MKQWLPIRRSPEPARTGALTAPWTGWVELFAMLDRMMEGSASVPFPPTLAPVPGWSAAPAFRTVRTDEGLELRADLPGWRRRDLEIELEDDVLTIQGRRISRKRRWPRGRGVRGTEMASFTTRLRVPDRVDPGRISAVCRKGTLTLRLPFRQSGRRIAVNRAA